MAAEDLTVDELYEVRNNFLLGGYQTAINEASATHTTTERNTIDKDCFVFRSYIAQGNYEMVLSELPAQDDVIKPPELHAVRLYAEFCSASSDEEEGVLTKIKSLMSSARSSELLLMLAGSAYAHRKQFDEALKCVIQTKCLEGRCMVVNFLTAMNRPDLAQKEFLHIQKNDDDSAGTLIAQAKVLFALGGEGIEEALLIYNELMEKFTPTPMLLNCAAACLMKMGRFAEADGMLLSALEKDNKDADTLLNLAACSLHIGAPSERSLRFYRQAKAVASSHPEVAKRIATESAFDKAAQEFTLKLKAAQ